MDPDTLGRSLSIAQGMLWGLAVAGVALVAGMAWGRFRGCKR